MDTIAFLSELFKYTETGCTQIFTLPNKIAKAIPANNLTSAEKILAKISNQDIYFSPGVSATPQNRRLCTDDIIGIPALWIDIDIYCQGAHSKPNLPQNIQEAYSLLPEFLPPSIIVHSGYGIHAWWLLRECWYFDTNEEKKQAQQLLTRLQAYIRNQAALAGWHLDSTTDLSRVMRLPGTLNHKLPDSPVQSKVIECALDLRYNQSEIDEILPDLEQVAATKPAQRKEAFERRKTDGPAEYMLNNCLFLQHCQLNAATISYDEWLAALVNVVRAEDGVEAAHSLSALDKVRYNKTDCDKKIDECLSNMQGYTCELIKTQLGFKGCPPNGCGVTTPCSWSLGKIPQARALLKSKSILTPEDVYNQKTLGALALLEKEHPVEYDSFYAKLPKEINKNTFKKKFAEHKREAKRKQAGFEVFTGGVGADSANPTNKRHLMQTVPDVPLNLWLPASDSDYSRWEFSNEGIFLHQEAADGKEKRTRAAYSPIIISERIKNVDTNQEKLKLTFKDEENRWKSIIVPKEIAYNARTVTVLIRSGPNFTSENAKTLVRWFSALEAANSQSIPTKQGVTKLGWRDYETKFILPGVASDYTIDLGDSAAESAIAGIGHAGDYNTWLKAMKELRTRNKARFIMAASFAAPLLKITGQRSFLMHNWDTTRGGKSATLFAALSIWGNPEEICKMFDDSKTNTERTTALFTDLPLGINEYEILNEKQKGEVESKIYQIAEGKGRGRATREGLQETVKWRTIALMTGETQITRHNTRGGVFTRLIEIKGGPLADDDIFASSLYPLTARNYGHAGKFFIEKLLEADHDKLREMYNDNRIVLRKKYPQKIESHLDAIACIVVAEYLAGIWIFGLEENQAKLEASVMAQLIIEGIITKSEASEPEQAWDWLPDWLAANECYFIKDTDSFNKKNTQACLGRIEENHIFIIKSELDKALTKEGFNAAKILAAWADEGKFPCTVNKDGKRRFGTKGKSINGAQPWLIKVAKNNWGG